MVIFIQRSQALYDQFVKLEYWLLCWIWLSSSLEVNGPQNITLIVDKNFMCHENISAITIFNKWNVSQNID